MDAKLIPCSPDDLKPGDFFTWGSHYTAWTFSKFDGGMIHYNRPSFTIHKGYAQDLKEGGDEEAVLFGQYFEGSLRKVVPAHPAEATPHDRQKIASDGLSTDYYRLPEHATELRHLISHKDMSFARGNVFKACYRLGEKQGVDALYDINKIIFFANEMKEMIERGERV